MLVNGALALILTIVKPDLRHGLASLEHVELKSSMGSWLFSLYVSILGLWMWLIIPPATKLRGGILDSPCSSVRLSVCLSVCPSVRPSVGRCPDDNSNSFQWIFLHISLGSRSCMGLNISVLPHQICAYWLIMWLTHVWHSRSQFFS